MSEDAPQLIPKNLIQFENFSFFDQDVKDIEKTESYDEKSEDGLSYNIQIDLGGKIKTFEYQNRIHRDNKFEELMAVLSSFFLVKHKISSEYNENRINKDNDYEV